MKIKCSFFEKGEVNTNPDGQVHPCCFFANTLFLAKQFAYPKKGEIDLRDMDHTSIQNGLQNSEIIAETLPNEPWSTVFKEYIENEDLFNLENYSLEEILNSDWFNKLEESRKDWNTSPRVCRNWCSVDETK